MRENQISRLILETAVEVDRTLAYHGLPRNVPEEWKAFSGKRAMIHGKRKDAETQSRKG